MKKKRIHLLLLAAVLTATAMLSAAGPAASQCIPWMCWIADANTTCCWDEYCNLWCG